MEKDTGAKCLLGFSGGSDSIGTLYIADRLGFDVSCAVIDYDIFPKKKNVILDEIKKRFKTYTIKKDQGKYYTMIKDLLENDIKPCSFCFESKMRLLKSFAKKHGFRILITGDIVSKREQSIELEEGLVILALPAFMNLTERELTKFSKKICNEKTFYACPVPYLISNNNIKLNHKWRLFWRNKMNRWWDGFDEYTKERLGGF